MKSGLDIAKDAYALLNVPDVTNGLTGGVYLISRPTNSILQDIVIGTLALTNDQLQAGVINVNCHAPNLQLQIKSKPDTSQPDLTTLNNMATSVSNILYDVYGGEYKMWIAQPGIVIKDEDGTYFINIRVNYEFFQPNYQNI